MTIALNQAIVYDIETFPNLFSLSAEMLNHPTASTWEISPWRDDRRDLLTWFDYLHRNEIPMIGFNILAFDYPVIHELMLNPNLTVDQIYQIAQERIRAGKFGKPIWQDKRFAPQVDLFKINHFDNDAKRTSLKALQINMREQEVVETPVPFGTVLNYEQRGQVLYYGGHDTSSTKNFAHSCMTAIKFRAGLVETIQGDVLNFNDTKIGEQLLIQRIGEDICFDRVFIETDRGGYYKKTPRQTVRSRIALREIIFPYITFKNSEFARVLEWMKGQTLTGEDISDPDAPVQTKGVFKGVNANVGGLVFHFGTGGIHASVTPQVIRATPGYRIRDVDVSGYYPKAAIVNKLAPAHLGEHYVREYTKLPIERAEWQKKKGKKCVEANSLKLSQNGVYGKSNSAFSAFYDPQYTLSVTINCQLLLCMLAEWLLTVPTLQIIAANTDGITYFIKDEFEPQAAEVCKQWQAFTLLELEDAEYKRMFIRDVNSYIAENTKGELKLKGAYWHPDPFNYAESISEAQPPAWHKDLSNIVSIKAAVAAMVHGVPPEIFIPCHTDKFDFMLRAKVNNTMRLTIGENEIQRTSRYYVANNGASLLKHMRATGPIGEYKQGRKADDATYFDVMQQIGKGVWDQRIHTKNKSKYEARVSEVEAGWVVAECNNANRFDFANLNYRYYIDEAKKLIIPG